MLGLSCCERRAVTALPAFLLLLALLVLIVDVAWQLRGRSALTCWTPQEFPKSWDDYAGAYCSLPNTTRYGVVGPRRAERFNASTIDDPSKAARTLPLDLGAAAVLLLVPLAFGDLLARVAAGLAPPGPHLGRLGLVLRCVCLLVERLLLVVFHMAAAARLGRRLAAHQGLTLSAVGRSFFSGDLAALYSTGGPSVVFCDFTIKKLGRNSRYSLQCIVKYGPQIVAAKVGAVAAWIGTASMMTWLLVGTAATVLLLIVPSSRARLTSLGHQEPDTELQGKPQRQDAAEKAT